MTLNITNPERLHDPVPFGYSHVARGKGEVIFIAGQYGSDADGDVVSDDFAEQVAKSFENLGVALRAAGLDYGNVAKLGTFVVDHDQDKLLTISRLVHEHWGNEPPVQTLVGVASLALPGMLFEVDAVAIRE